MNDPEFWNKAAEYSASIVVVGFEGVRYHWRVERATDLFLSYGTSPRRLVDDIAAILTADHPKNTEAHRPG